MKHKIIEQLSEKKNPNGAEAFFLICANAEKLSPQFRKTFSAMLRHFEAIEQLKLDQKKREQSIEDAYSSLVMSGNFHEETAKLIAQKRRQDQQAEQAKHSLNPTQKVDEVGNRKEEAHVSQLQSFDAPPPGSFHR